MPWTTQVPLIVDGDPGDQDTFNAPLQALIDRTDYLKSQVEAITNKGNLVAFRVNTSADAEAGDLVYFDTACEEYKRALAVWRTDYIANGELLAADSAYVKGWVLRKHSTTLADILLDGLYTDAALATHLLGAGADPGMYYLSATTAGRAVLAPPALKVPAVTYVGGSSVIFKPSDVFQPNHLHKYHVLRQHWYLASDSRFDDMEKPAHALRGYDVDSDPGFKEWFAAYPGQLAVFIDGLLQDPAQVVTTKDNVWWMGTYGGSSSSSVSISSASSESSPSTSSSQSSGTLGLSSSSTEVENTSSSVAQSTSSTSQSSTSQSTQSGTSESSESSSTSASSSSSIADEWPNGAKSIVAYAYSPFVSGEPLVRTVKTNTPCELEVSSQNGSVSVSMQAWQADQAAATGLAVVNIIDRNMKLAPSVSEITGGPGMTVTNTGNGKYNVSAWDYIEALRDAEVVDLNNALELTDSPFYYLVFPASRESSVLGMVPLPKLGSGNTYDVAAWVYRRGIPGASTGSPITYPAIAVELTHVPSPKHQSTVVMPTVPGVSTSIAAEANTVATKLYYGETPATARLVVGCEGTVYAKLTMASGDHDKYLTRFGIIVYLKSGSSPVVVPCGG